MNCHHSKKILPPCGHRLNMQHLGGKLKKKREVLGHTKSDASLKIQRKYLDLCAGLWCAWLVLLYRNVSFHLHLLDKSTG